MLPHFAGLFLVHLTGHVYEPLINSLLQLFLSALDLIDLRDRVSVSTILGEILGEINLGVVSLIVLLKILLREEEFGTVLALHDALLLFGRQTHQVLIGAQGLLFDFEFLLHGFQILHLRFELGFKILGLRVPLTALGVQYLVHALEVVLGVQQVLNGELR